MHLLYNVYYVIFVLYYIYIYIIKSMIYVNVVKTIDNYLFFFYHWIYNYVKYK